MFKNHSFQKAILVLTILTLLAGAVIASLPHTVFVAGLPLCKASSGNCKPGSDGGSSQGAQIAILVRYPKTCFDLLFCAADS